MKKLRLNLEQQMYEELLDVFMPSADMREYLKTKMISPESIMQIILGSPVNLNIKEEWLKILSEVELVEEFYSEKFENEEMFPTEIVTFKDLYCDVNKALKKLWLYRSVVYTVEDCWYDYDIHEKKSYLLDVDNSYLGMMGIIEYELSEEELENDNTEKYPTWFEVKMWGKAKGGGLKPEYTFYYLGKELIWFEEAVVTRDLDKNYSSAFPYLKSLYMHLPIPYKAGDIVAIDTYPSGPAQAAIIFDISDSGEFVSVLTRGVDGKWHDGGLFDGSWGRSVYQNDWISPLFNIRKWDESLNEDAAVFDAVYRYVKAEEGNSGKLWQALYDSQLDIYTDDELLELIAGL